MSESREVARALAEAEALARHHAAAPSTAHLLLALWRFPNRARMLLEERRGDLAAACADAARALPPEPGDAWEQLRHQATLLAASTHAPEVDCLHVLAAMARLRDCAAYRVLERSGARPAQLRTVALGYLTAPLPRRFHALPEALAEGATAHADVSAGANDSHAAGLGDADGEVGRDCGRRGRPMATGARLLGPSAGEPPATSLPCPTDIEHGRDGGDGFSRDARDAEEIAARGRHPRPGPTSRASAPAWRQGRGPLAGRHEPLESVAPTLAGVAVDLTARARAGELDAVIGRGRELEAIVDILGKRRANNPLLVGAPGVGKTALVEGLAVKLSSQDPDVAHLSSTRLVALDTGALTAGTSLRGAFTERMVAIKEEVAAAAGRIVVFIDEIHMLIGAGGSGEGPQDAAGELKTALARGTFPCIGATTPEEYRRHIERDAALTRRFLSIAVDEPSPDEALTIVRGAIGPYAAHHRRPFTAEAVDAAVALTHRFVHERQLPDKALAALDLAGSRARRRGAARVGRQEVAEVVAEWTQVPLARLLVNDAGHLADAEAALGAAVVGHRAAIATLAAALRRGFAGLQGHRPMGSLLLAGPSGVGKTELTKALAQLLFGRRDALTRLDMSELSERHAVARLIGAQPGYVGYEDGGQLTEALRRRPFQIVLFDEVDKAHPDVLALLLQILDEGHLTDSHGRRVSFRHSLIVLTTYVGASAAQGAVGFAAGAQAGACPTLEAARRRLGAELWGRLDEAVALAPLDPAELAEVARRQLVARREDLCREHGATLSWDDAVVAHLVGNCVREPGIGARAVRRALQQQVDGLLATWLLRRGGGDGPAPAGIRLICGAGGPIACQDESAAPAAPAARSA